MGKEIKEALTIRLNLILAHLQANRVATAQEEMRELIEEVTDGIVAPF